LLAYFLVPGLLCANGCRTDRGKSENGARAARSVTDAEALSVATTLCDTLHGLSARRKAECCGTPPRRILIDQCVQLVSRSVASYSLELSRDALATCSADMSQALEGCDWVTPSEPLSPPSCQRLFRGLVSAGGTCRSSLECADTLHCEGTTPTKPGVCSAPGNVGAGCGTHVDALAAATLTRDLERSRPFCADFCSLTSHKCEPQPKEGASCLASVSCARGQSCVAGACSKARRGGQGQGCQSASCEDGLRCVDGECRAPAAPGAACSSDFDCAEGGCVTNASGAATCGPKCSLSFAQLKNESALGMRLPLRPRSEGASR
jgi:hypothetical protein